MVKPSRSKDKITKIIPQKHLRYFKIPNDHFYSCGKQLNDNPPRLIWSRLAQLLSEKNPRMMPAEDEDAERLKLWIQNC